MSTHPQATKTKYRPVLTAAQITHILALAKSESPLSDLSISIISTLSPFAAKIANAGITPAYETKPAKLSTLEALGGAMTPKDNFFSSHHATKEQYWEDCYNKYQFSPSSCNLEEIRGMQEHKYLHDLMTEAELTAFEAELTSNL